MFSLFKSRNYVYLCPLIMGNSSFQFKQFTVFQEKCGMKVGTDGTLLGAWAPGGKRILDVGTGTGLIALMMAQRFPDAEVMGVDIDHDAAVQASENVKRSPFAERIRIVESDVQYIDGQFDCILSNPPFFEDSLVSPDSQRTKARHTVHLTFERLFQKVKMLLTDDGIFSLIVPFNYKSRILEEAALTGFFLVSDWAVKTTPRKAPKRFLLSFACHPKENVDAGEGVLEDAPGQRSEWYKQFTDAFYIR